MGNTIRLRQDISSILNSEEAVLQKLPSIFPDIIILDQHFNIAGISQKVLDFLEYVQDDVENKSINFLSGATDLATALAEDLLAGYFEEKGARFISKSKRRVSVTISGFYLGAVRHLNGFILLRIKNIDEHGMIERQLAQTKMEMDNFIYRTAHDLRGPLATIRGLVNLIKLRNNNDDLEMLVPLLDSHANKLDARLSSLVYLAQADQEFEQPRNVIDFTHIEKSLQKIVEQNDLGNFLEIEFSVPDQKLEGLNEILTLSLFSNLLLHVLSFPMSQLRNRIAIIVTPYQDCLTITIGAQGFMVSDANRSPIEQEHFSYMEMVRYPHLVNFYGAKKIASRMNAQIDFRFLSEENQMISVTIPISKGGSFLAS